jgi:hypothetical protein
MRGVLGRIFDFSQKFQSILETFAEHLITFLFEAKRSEKNESNKHFFRKKTEMRCNQFEEETDRECHGFESRRSKIVNRVVTHNNKDSRCLKTNRKEEKRPGSHLYSSCYLKDQKNTLFLCIQIYILHLYIDTYIPKR